ncbi:PREDICTED: transmembrane protein 128-like [Acropora digitifera]|uniref:transmembrane protein 128-like n=1 Tax=Acropora digitifera TaxID=70779 RepID=UPI000779F46B|nr:PREDICTED: transmembrane protein 128-like [Acropora digitifera]XP_029198969.1 transmembrane protein 128-like [Acropora millepora]
MASTSDLSGYDDLTTAFIRHRERKSFDRNLDERIKARGEKILKENHPRNTSRINSHSVFWMLAALAVFYYSDFYIALRVDSRIHRTWLYVGGGLIGVNLSIGCYCVLWLSYYKKITDWDKHSPYIIPIATASFIAGMICSTYALWPIWRLLTPFIVFTLFMGVIFLATLIPL